MECEVCSKTFAKSYVLYRHLREVHGLATNTNPCNMKCQETSCEKAFKNIPDLRTHLVKEHGLTQYEEVVSLSFPDFKEFEEWRRKEERETNNQFVKPRGVKTSTDCKKKIHYLCRRSGYARLKESERKRELKVQGTCKLGHHCTAEMKVEIEDTVQVLYYKNHYKHDFLLGHTTLHKEERQTIAGKLVQGVTEKRILSDIHHSVNNKIDRMHLVTNKDLHNIKQSFGIDASKIKNREPDHISVEMWVEEMKKDDKNQVLLYKQQNEEYPGLEKDDFILIMMSELQKKMFFKFGSDRICIDSTHGLTGYDFELTTIMVVDEHEEGFPVAFCCSSKVNTAIMSVFFTCLKEQVGIIVAKTFMSDDAAAFYNSWLQVMGPVENRLLCAWHVDRAWQGHLSSIKDKEKRTAVYQSLKACMLELDEAKFNHMYLELLEQLQDDEETVHFYNYLESYYSRRTETWAYCFRTNAKINTNMHIENFHRNIKHIYLAGKKSKRVDKCIQALNAYLLDKQFDRLVKLHKGKMTTKLSNLHSRHRWGVNLKENCRTLKPDMLWEVTSSMSTQVYTVRRVEHLCTEMCSITCVQCKVCFKEMSCTCHDYTIKNNMCKHIHAICMNMFQYNHSNGREAIQPHDISVQVNEETLFHESLLTSKRNQKEDMVKKNAELLSSMTAKIQCNKTLSLDILNAVHAHLKAANELLSVSVSDSASFNATDIAPFNEPANKNIEKQKRFFSVKKARPTKERLKKPTGNQMQQIKAVLEQQELLTNQGHLDHAY